MAGMNIDPPFTIKYADSVVARFIELMLGTWLLASALLVTYTDEQRVNVGAVGALMIVVALVAIFVDERARLANLALAAWLIVSSFALPSAGTEPIVTNLVVALLAFGLATVPSYGPPRWLERWQHRRFATA
jgi:hypothetical protein